MVDIDNTSTENSVPFYPDHVSNEAKVVLGISVVAVVIGLIGLFSPVGLGPPADAMNTPAHVKPEWYFLGLYQLLKYISKTAGAVLPVLGVVEGNPVHIFAPAIGPLVVRLARADTSH